MLQPLDNFLNNVTMYRLTLYVLVGLVIAAAGLSFLGILNYNPINILLSAVISIAFAYISNWILARFFHATTNFESVFITALILTLIIPTQMPRALPFIALAAVVAMGSKYFVTIGKQHVFNPAAGAVAAIELLSPEHTPIWWIGTASMLPFVLIGGFLIVRKIRRESMVITFLFVVFVLITISAFVRTQSFTGVLSIWQQSIFDSPLFFFSFIMLTEPITAPVNHKLRSYYATFIAVLYTTPQLQLFSFALTPEIALVIGNFFSFFSSPKYRLVLPLIKKIKLTYNVLAFEFAKPNNFNFQPGQYMEWTLSQHNGDARGNRRYFTIASSPTEKDLLLEVKFFNPSSSFKNTLKNLVPGDSVLASHLAGDFILPKNLNEQLVFIAGGVGIAPFRSMIKYIIDKNLKANITVLFVNKRPDDITYADILEKATANGIKTIYVLTENDAVPPNWKGKVGHIDATQIKNLIPDWKNRTFYLSGPQLMVQSFENELKKLGINSNRIMIDYFPGYKDK